MVRPTDFRRLAGLSDERTLNEGVNDLSGVTFKKGRSNIRGFVRQTFNLSAKDGGMTDHEKDWSYDPNSIKPTQFARLEVSRETMWPGNIQGLDAALKAIKSKSIPKGEYGGAPFNSVRGAVVAQAFQGKGYGLALLLKALESSTEGGFWLANDFKGTDTAAALRTWDGLEKYAKHFFRGEQPINRESFAAISGRWDAATLARGTHPFLAAYGLNAKGEKALKEMQ